MGENPGDEKSYMVQTYVWVWVAGLVAIFATMLALWAASRGVIWGAAALSGLAVLGLFWYIKSLVALYLGMLLAAIQGRKTP